MKKNFNLLIILFIVIITFGLNTQLNAQENHLSKEYKASSIKSLCQLMNDNYVFPEVAKKTEEHLNKQLKKGHFKQFNTLETFAKALTESVQYINKDKHMNIRANSAYQAEEKTTQKIIEQQLEGLDYMRSFNAGFKEVKKLDGNVGYLDLRAFASPDIAKSFVDNYMSLLATSDAIIVDLSHNGGGSPVTVQYLCSYFFKNKVHLNSLYWRKGDRTDEFWTLEEVDGKKMPEVPLYIITSENTFSAAEEFSYNMQTQKRATLVGQTTGGGANPGGTQFINNDLGVFIPTGRAINPITKTNWEGVGVIPEVKTNKEETFNKAHELAKIAAEEYRNKTNGNYKSILTQLHNTLGSYNAYPSDNLVTESLKQCKKAGLMSEGDINNLGYKYLMQLKKPQTAEIIFKSNTIIHPNSANVYDSYAEALASSGKLKLAITNYQKAVNLAKVNDDPTLELFTKNLEAAKMKMKGK